MSGSTGVRYQRSTKALARRIGPDVLVAVPADERVHELSGGASALWAGLSVPRTVNDLVDLVAKTHDVSRDDIAEQVERCIETFLALGIVEARSGADV